jgi:dimethylamine monooxygenase subunit A
VTALPFDFSLVSAPFRMQPGLRRVAAGAAQLTPSAPGGRHLREKTAVLASFASRALVALSEFDPAPVLGAVAAEAALRPPAAFFVDAAARLDANAPLLGWSIRDGEPVGEGDPVIGALLADLPQAQRATALLCLAFEEDFAVLDGDSATVPWLAVCLPSRWAPTDKVGRHFAEIHAPVADNAMLVAASASLARLVTGFERWERFVWTITADPHLNHHPAQGASPWPAGIDADALATIASLRSEHQTFIPIAASRQAVFTIHIESQPLITAVADADAAQRLHDALASMSPAVLAYRGLVDARDRLLTWLATRSAQRSPG